MNTNIVQATIQAGQVARNVAQSGINWTLLISVVSVSLATMGTLIRIFGSSVIKDENLRSSTFLKELAEDHSKSDSKIEKNKEEENTRYMELKELINRTNVDLEKLKVESSHSAKSLEDLRQDNRELVQRLDDLLKHLLDWVNN